MSDQEARSAAKKPEPNCPSCHGTGWATIFAGTLAVAGGVCSCRGGLVGEVKSAAQGREPRVGELWKLPFQGSDMIWRVSAVGPRTVKLAVTRDYGLMEATCSRAKFLKAAEKIKS